MNRIFAIAAAVALCACIHPIPTPAVVAQLTEAQGGRQFRGCTVNLAWTEQDLLGECGPPDLGFVTWANHPGSRCALYRTVAKSFALGLGADVVAVCLARPPPGSNGAQSSVRVQEVFGLAASAAANAMP
jgi:hypothetical protein